MVKFLKVMGKEGASLGRESGELFQFLYSLKMCLVTSNWPNGFGSNYVILTF